MGRWIYQRHNQYSEDVGKECVVIVDEKNNTIAKRVLGEDGPEQFPFIKDSHNADCAAYEARIAELEAEQGRLRQIILDDGMELARVMAESLRVVVDGEAVGMDELSCNEWLLLFDGNVYYREYECGTFTTFDDRALFIATDDAVVVTPVRLERWETEE